MLYQKQPGGQCGWSTVSRRKEEGGNSAEGEGVRERVSR